MDKKVKNKHIEEEIDKLKTDEKEFKESKEFFIGTLVVLAFLTTVISVGVKTINRQEQEYNAKVEKLNKITKEINEKVAKKVENNKISKEELEYNIKEEVSEYGIRTDTIQMEDINKKIKEGKATDGEIKQLRWLVYQEKVIKNELQK